MVILTPGHCILSFYLPIPTSTICINENKVCLSAAQGSSCFMFPTTHASWIKLYCGWLCDTLAGYTVATLLLYACWGVSSVMCLWHECMNCVSCSPDDEDLVPPGPPPGPPPDFPGGLIPPGQHYYTTHTNKHTHTQYITLCLQLKQNHRFCSVATICMYA